MESALPRAETLALLSPLAVHILQVFSLAGSASSAACAAGARQEQQLGQHAHAGVALLSLKRFRGTFCPRVSQRQSQS